MIGIVTEADLLADTPSGQTVGKVMTTNVISVPKHMAASVAGHRMATYGLRALPLVEGYDTHLLAGVLTPRDLIGETK